MSRSIELLRQTHMSFAVSLIVCAVFVALALWHFRMATQPAKNDSSAVPSVDGKPLFVPSATATICVGIALLLFAGLVAARAGFVSIRLPMHVLSWLCYALALGLLARAMGDFKYVGFFKRVRDSKFARLDTLIYSPLCLFLSIGVATVASSNGR